MNNADNSAESDMEEILANIRRIFSEDSEGHQTELGAAAEAGTDPFARTTSPDQLSDAGAGTWQEPNAQPDLNAAPDAGNGVAGDDVVELTGTMVAQENSARADEQGHDVGTAAAGHDGQGDGLLTEQATNNPPLHRPDNNGLMQDQPSFVVGGENGEGENSSAFYDQSAAVPRRTDAGPQPYLGVPVVHAHVPHPNGGGHVAGEQFGRGGEPAARPNPDEGYWPQNINEAESTPSDAAGAADVGSTIDPWPAPQESARSEEEPVHEPVSQEPASNEAANEEGSRFGDAQAAHDDSVSHVAEIEPGGPQDVQDSVSAVSEVESGEPQDVQESVTISEAVGLALNGNGTLAAEVAEPTTDTAVGGASERSLEDTVAGLLKPLLREWLDANMPRIIEKAIKSDGSEPNGSGSEKL